MYSCAGMCFFQSMKKTIFNFYMLKAFRRVNKSLGDAKIAHAGALSETWFFSNIFNITENYSNSFLSMLFLATFDYINAFVPIFSTILYGIENQSPNHWTVLRLAVVHNSLDNQSQALHVHKKFIQVFLLPKLKLILKNRHNFPLNFKVKDLFLHNF